MHRPYQEIGAILRNAREEQRMSLRQVSESLHIRVDYLLALEDGDYSPLPGITYAKGYLRRYVSFLHLDQTEILRRLEVLQRESRTPFFYLPHTFSEEKQTPPELVWKSLIALAAVLLVWSMWVRVEHGHVPLVDAVPESGIPVAAVPDVTRNGEKYSEQSPCAKPQPQLYPPCIWRQDALMTKPYLPLQRHVMEWMR